MRISPGGGKGLTGFGHSQPYRALYAACGSVSAVRPRALGALMSTLINDHCKVAGRTGERYKSDSNYKRNQPNKSR